MTYVEQGLRERTAPSTGKRIKRDAFLYLDPKGDKDQFAQCSTCMMFTGEEGQTCTIHGKKKIHGGMSCGLYVNGPNHTDMIGKEMEAVTPEESGLYDGQVRCENCKHFDEGYGSVCTLFEMLNRDAPQLFNLDDKVNKKGCCNAFSPISVG